MHRDSWSKAYCHKHSMMCIWCDCKKTQAKTQTFSLITQDFKAGFGRSHKNHLIFPNNPLAKLFNLTKRASWLIDQEVKKTPTNQQTPLQKEKRLNYFISSLFICSQFLLSVHDIVFRYALPKAMFKQWGLKSKTTHQPTPKHIFTIQHLRKGGNSAFSRPSKMQKIPSQNQGKNCNAWDSGGKSYCKSALKKQEAT